MANYINIAARLDELLKRSLSEQGGIAGPPNKLTVKSTTTGDPGTEAIVRITGQSPNQEIEFVIPRGNTGPIGPAGPEGRPGKDGQNGLNGAPGAPGQNGAPGVDGRDGVNGKDGKDGTGITPNGYGPLTEFYIAQVEAGGVDWLYVVTTDDRANKNLPAGIAGDQARNIISYDTDNGWHTIAPFTGVQGPPGRDGVDGVNGKDGAPGAPGLPGTPGTNGKDGRDGVDGINGTDGQPGPPGRDGRDGVDGAPGPKSIDTFGAISTSTVSFADGSPDWVTYTATGATTWTFTGAPTGKVVVRFIQITNGAAGVQTFPSSAKWDGGVKPEFSSGVDILAVVTIDGGVTNRIVQWTKDSK